MTTACRVGTSGWIYPHWRGVFYPAQLRQREWFSYYTGHFDTVEINYTFYRLPPDKTFEHWREVAPDGFTYALKANRFLTHIKRLKEAGDELERFLSRARLLGDHLGPILWQLPPNWRADPARLRAFVAALPKDISHAFEFRDERWFVESVREILTEAGVSTCIYDMPGLECPTWVTGEVVYLRFHGVGISYGGRYAEDGLRPWVRRVGEWIQGNHRVYAYFNNDAFGYAVEDAATLRELLRASAGPGG